MDAEERKKRIAALVKLRTVRPIIEWDDIEEGKWYHLPPLMFNPRMDFIVDEKREKSLRIRKRGETYYQTLWKGDMQAKFITKPWRIKNKL